jgi:hypothetical protein
MAGPTRGRTDLWQDRLTAGPTYGWTDFVWTDLWLGRRIFGSDLLAGAAYYWSYRLRVCAHLPDAQNYCPAVRIGPGTGHILAATKRKRGRRTPHVL